MPSLPVTLQPWMTWLLQGFILLMVLAAGPADSLKPANAAEVKKPTPEQLKKILADFDRYAEEARQAWQVPGMAITVVLDDKVVFSKGYGVKQVGKTDKVDEHTIFQIGSTTKAFTAALMAMQVDEKKFNWPDLVVDHLPQFQMFDPWVTRQFMVEDLMAQHTGLPQYAGDNQAIMGFDRAHLIHSLYYLKPATSFRSRYAYQNIPFLVAAALVEKFTGKSWEANIKSRIFHPLEMTSSSTGLEAFNAAKNRTFLHIKKNGQVVALPRDWAYNYWVYTYGPAGGINANVVDMAKWMRLQLGQGKFQGRQLVSAKNLEYLHTPKTFMGSMEGELFSYCEGWVLTERRPYPLIWHTGGTTGNNTIVALVPEAKVGLVMLANLNSQLPFDLTWTFYDLFFSNPPKNWRQIMKNKEADEKAAKAPRQPPANPAPPLPLERYAGVYQNQVYGQVRIAADNKVLKAIWGPQAIKTDLAPVDRDTFKFSWPDSSDSDELNLAVFTIGPDGHAQSLSLNWDESGAEFKRLEAKPGSS
jgi:CubicO group peptidase (beta-lactamase class C family)